MAITDPLALVNTGSTANTTTYDAGATASMSIGDVALIFVFAVRNAAAADAPTLSNNGGTGTFSITSQATGSLDGNAGTSSQTDTDGYRVTCGWARCTSAGTLIVRATFANSLTGCNIVVVPLRGTHTTQPIRQIHATSGTASRPSYSLGSTPQTSSWTFTLDSIRRTPPAWTNEGGSWIEDADSTGINPNHGYYVSHLEAADQSTTYSAGTNGTWRGMMIEVAEAVQSLTAVTLTTTPTLPAADVQSGVSLTAATLTTTPSLPAARVDHRLTAATLTTTPSLPAARVDHRITAATLTVTPTQPAAAVTIPLYAATLTTTPTQPAARIDQILTAAALSATPTLPSATLRTSIGTATLSVTPTLPAARIDHRLAAAALTVSPTMPAAAVTTVVTAATLTVSPTLPTASIRHSLGAATLVVTPTLPAAEVANFTFLQAAVLSVTPTQPAALLSTRLHAGSAIECVPAFPQAQVLGGNRRGPLVGDSPRHRTTRPFASRRPTGRYQRPRYG